MLSLARLTTLFCRATLAALGTVVIGIALSGVALPAAAQQAATAQPTAIVSNISFNLPDLKGRVVNAVPKTLSRR